MSAPPDSVYLLNSCECSHEILTASHASLTRSLRAVNGQRPNAMPFWVRTLSHRCWVDAQCLQLSRQQPEPEFACMNMARLRRKSIDDSEDDLPDLADIIGKGTADVNTPPQARKEQSKSAVVGPKQLDNPSHRPDSFSESFYEKQTSTSPAGKVPCLNSASNQVGGSALRQSPQRAAKKSIDYSKYVTATISAGLPSSEDDEYSTDLSGFIVSDSDSALENVHPMISRKQKPSSPRKWPTKQKAISNSRPDAALQLQRSFEFIDLSSPKRHVSDSQESSKGRGENSRRSSDACDNSAIIKLSVSLGFDYLTTIG